MTELFSFLFGCATTILVLGWIGLKRRPQSAPVQKRSDKAVDALRSIARVQQIKHAHKIANRTLEEIG